LSSGGSVAVHLLDGLGAGVEVDGVLPSSDFGAAGRQDEALLGNRIDHVGGRQTMRIQRLRIKIHHDLPGPPAVGKRHARALHVGELGAHKVDGVIKDLLLAERLAR